jgi:hypothetical protein
MANDIELIIREKVSPQDLASYIMSGEEVTEDAIFELIVALELEFADEDFCRRFCNI